MIDCDIKMSHAGMAALDRDAFHKLRQQWARENFGTTLDSAPQSSSRLDEESEPLYRVNEGSASKPEPARTRSGRSSRAKPGSTYSWTASLCGRLEEELSEMTALPAPPQRPPSGRSAKGETITQTALPAVPSEEHEAEALPSWLTEIYTLSYLIFFAVLGTLARLGTEAVTRYPAAPVTSRVLWANLGGSFLMGLLVGDRRTFDESSSLLNSRHDRRNAKGVVMGRGAQHLAANRNTPLYIGLTVGFCGSFTNFSAFIRDAFLALTNALETPSASTPFRSAPKLFARHGGFSFLALMSILVIHPAISLAALRTGAQLAGFLQSFVPPVPPKLLSRFLNPLMIILGIGSWLGAALVLALRPPYPPLTIDTINWRARALMPALFAPPGCLLRYYLSRYANKMSPSFPVGTFVANVVATAILGMAYDLQHTKSITSPNICAILAGVMAGFCGSLGSMSTWVFELDSLGYKNGWIYGLCTVAVALSIAVCIMGGMGWTTGFVSARCG